MSALVGVVVVNYGSHELLAQNLTVLGRPGDDLVVVVVDNHSSDAEREAVTELCRAHGWVLVPSATNLGFGAGANLGAVVATDRGAELLLLLNPDAQITPDDLGRLVEGARSAGELVLAAPVVRRRDGSVWSDGTDLLLATGRMRATRKRPAGSREEVVEWVSGACLLVTTPLWTLVGGFDESYFLYWEDVDLSHRCRQAGGTVLVVREATAVHDEGGTQGRTDEHALSETYYYYNIRNRLLFAGRHLDQAGRRRWRRSSLSEAGAVMLRGGGRRGLLRSAAPWRAAALGTLDGLRTMRPSSGSAPGPSRLRVLQSFPEPRSTTNPYLVMLRGCLDASAEVELSTFSWRRALTQRYDVFHAHWPEILVTGRTDTRKVARQLLFLAFLLRLRLGGTAIVRTLHNLDLPEGISTRERLLLLLFQHWTTLVIRLNITTQVTGRPVETILHGHYREWFAGHPHTERVAGRFAYVGLIRRYKAVDTLIEAFRAVPRPSASLSVGGKPSSDQLQAELVSLAARDPRVHLHLDFLSDAELVAAVTAAELVVLPYREMHNSGGVLAALSLDRPVLVPDNEVNQLLADEVGPGWVLPYHGAAVSSADLDQALRESRGPDRGRSPNLSGRGWDLTADRHVTAYRRAVQALRRGRLR